MEAVMGYLEKAEPTPYTFWLGYVHYVLICKPEDLQVVLNNSNCLEKSNFYKFFVNTVGEGLFSSPVEKWKKHRRLITPAFNIRLMETFFPIFNAKNERLVRRMEKEADTGEYFDLWPYISSNALDIICQTTMGYDINSLESTKVEFEEALKIASVEDSLRIYKPWLHPDFIFKLYIKFTGLTKSYELVHKLPEQIIERKQNELREKKLKLRDNDVREKSLLSFLDLLLELNEEGAEFSDTDIRDEVVTMMIGGSETSALTLSFTLLMLAMNSEVQERAYKEIEQILGTDERPILMEDVNKMVFLEQCIRETLRLFPPGPLILRKATKDVPLSDNFILRSGANIIIPPVRVQRHPNLYENPLMWNPENFSVEEVAKRHKYSFIAFSGGPRGCIGSKYAMFSMKVTVSMILQKYILRTEVKLEDIRLSLDLLMRSVHGYKIKLYSRKLKI
ncbi:hypothetical protein V9T40_005471 [Parthenolecanium corni]|uniref:Cytochrome P450 n=1 Tax=Parthenolecanium corni TaxID=536013 RepID=A0AAN9TT11_9HEMI